MLSKTDREDIREIIREELKTALFTTITVERGPEKNGDPEKVVKEEEWNVLHFLAAYLPQIQGALRGMQEDTNKANNRSIEGSGKFQALGELLIGLEESVTIMARFAQALNQSGLLENMEKPLALPKNSLET